MYENALRYAALCTIFLLEGTLARECTGSTVIRNPEDLKRFKTCTTHTGNVKIQQYAFPAPASGSNGPQTQTIDISNLTTISNGSLEILDINSGQSSGAGGLRRRDPVPQARGNGASATSFTFSAPNLAKIDGDVQFTDVSDLERVDFSGLQSVKSISFSNVDFINNTNSLGTVNGGFETLQEIQNLTVTHTNLDSLNFAVNRPHDPNAPAQITVAYNADLAGIQLGFPGFNELHIAVQGNHQNLFLNLMNIKTAALYLEGILHLDVGGLEQIKAFDEQSTQVIASNAFTSLSFPSVTSIAGAVQIDHNNRLNAINLPMLKQASGLEIFSNPSLTTLAMATAVSGPFTLQCSAGVGCKPFGPNCRCQNAFSSGVSPSTSTASPSAGVTTIPTSTSSNSGLSSDAKIGIGVGVGVGLAVLIAAALIFYFCCRGRRRTSGKGGSTTREISNAEYSKASEVAYTKVSSYGGGMRVQELDRPGPRGGKGEEYTPIAASMGRDRDLVGGDRETGASMAQHDRLLEPQGVRHEMDARSLTDRNDEWRTDANEEDDDDEADTRSLEDIERVHRQR